MIVRGLKYGLSGRIIWRKYQDGTDAIQIVDDEGIVATATVCLYDPPPPHTPKDHIWIKTWSENEGMEKALADSGVVTLTSEVWPAGFAEAVLGKLTPEAIADRDRSC